MDIRLPGMYLPPISTFVYMSRGQKVHVVLSERYVKGSLRNTAQIAGPNGSQLLKIPVKKNKNGLMSEIMISNDEDWRRLHMRSIETAYGTAPFFEYYMNEIRDIYKADYLYLWELNVAFIDFLIKKLQIPVILAVDEKMTVDHELENDLVTFYGSKISNRSNISLKPYPQVFEYKFGWQNDLSILDLLMCLGPQGKAYLEEQNISI